MKAKLTLVYEKEIDPEDKNYYQEIVDEGEMQAVDEEFGIGWSGPNERAIEFSE